MGSPTSAAEETSFSFFVPIWHSTLHGLPRPNSHGAEAALADHGHFVDEDEVSASHPLLRILQGRTLKNAAICASTPAAVCWNPGSAVGGLHRGG